MTVSSGAFNRCEVTRVRARPFWLHWQAVRARGQDEDVPCGGMTIPSY